MNDSTILRVARPTDNLEKIASLYEKGLGYIRLSEFSDHDGFDGIIIGKPGHPYHLEFTTHNSTIAGKAPTKDNLLVFYLPNSDEWKLQCDKMIEAGFRSVESYNPYWDKNGKTFEDPDGYRVVLVNQSWDK